MMHQLFAITEEGKVRKSKRVVLDGRLQVQLSEELSRQVDELLPHDVELVEYDPGYKPDDEVFVIDGFPLPEYVQGALHAPDVLGALDKIDLEEGHVKALMGVDLLRRSSSTEIAFQSYLDLDFLFEEATDERIESFLPVGNIFGFLAKRLHRASRPLDPAKDHVNR